MFTFPFVFDGKSAEQCGGATDWNHAEDSSWEECAEAEKADGRTSEDLIAKDCAGAGTGGCEETTRLSPGEPVNSITMESTGQTSDRKHLVKTSWSGQMIQKEE